MIRTTIAALCAAAALGLWATQPALAQDATDNAAAVAALGGDAEKGARVFNKCKACHVADAETNRVGPYLMHVFGRHAGTVEGYNYSDAMKGADVVWNADTLSQYLASPKEFVPGNKMTFVGLKKPEDIANVLAYLYATAGETPPAAQ